MSPYLFSYNIKSCQWRARNKKNVLKNYYVTLTKVLNGFHLITIFEKKLYPTCLVKSYPFNSQQQEMVNHPQTIRRKTADKSFGCVWLFLGLAVKRLKVKTLFQLMENNFYVNNFQKQLLAMFQLLSILIKISSQDQFC